MTGEQLYKQLGKLTPEQRKLEVLCLAHDVGGNRASVYVVTRNRLEIQSINENGFPTEDDDPDDDNLPGTDCITI